MGVCLVQVIFSTALIEAFDLTKALTTTVISVILVWTFVGRSRHRTMEVGFGEIWPLAFVLLAALVATLTSTNVPRSIFGQDHRFTGLALLLACMSIAIAAARAVKVGLLERTPFSFAITVSLISAYALLQKSDLDPFKWSVVSFGSAPFSTLGNPNVLAASLAIMYPFVCFGLHRADRRISSLGYSVAINLGAIALSLADSFQGVFGPLAACLYLVMSLERDGRAEQFGVREILVGLTVGLNAVTVFLTAGSREFYLVLLISLVVGAVLTFTSDRQRSFPLSLSRAKLYLGLIFSLLVGAVALKDSISQAGYERSAFYRASWKAFLNRPVSGFGLENFGEIFPTFRPSWHAQDLPSSLTNSPHSVFIGSLATGGLILFVGYVLLFSVAGVRVVKLLATPEKKQAALLVAALFAVTSIFFVSVESVPLFVLGFFVVGLSLGSIRKTKGRNRVLEALSVFRRVPGGKAIAAVTLTVFVVCSMTILLSSESRFKDGMDALYLEGRADKAEIHFRRALDLRASEARYRMQLANSLLAQEKFEPAVNELLRALEDSNFNSNIGIEVMRILDSLGAGSFVDRVQEQVELRDPKRDF